MHKPTKKPSMPAALAAMMMGGLIQLTGVGAPPARSNHDKPREEQDRLKTSAEAKRERRAQRNIRISSK